MRASTESATERALIRAGFVRLAMGRAGALAPALEQHLREALGPELRRALEDAPLLGWLPYAVDVRMAEGILARRGAAGLRAFVLGNTAEAAQTATLRPILDGALRLFGVNPGSMLRVMPDIWRLSYRGVLDVRIERVGDREARIEGSRVCAELLASAAAQQVLVAQTEGAMALTRTSVRLDPLVVDRDRHAITLRVLW